MHVCRQQVEDLEGKVKSLKEQIKKKEENEKKYQGFFCSSLKTKMVLLHALLLSGRIFRPAEHHS